jgi:CheY-like chemotaxis protein
MDVIVPSGAVGGASKVSGTSIFLVEDEALIRMMLADMIEQLGHRVVAEAGNIEAGKALAETAIYDLAILDINIAGRNIRPVAEIVNKRGLPFVSSAAMDQEADQKHSGASRCWRSRCQRLGSARR